MPRFSMNQKAQRVLRFALGLRSQRAYAALAEYGFTQGHLREGVELLAAVIRRRINQRPVSQDPQFMKALHDFEGRWFPIARATLSRHHPDIEAQLMLNLGRTDGIDVAVTVGTFVERLQAMQDGQAPFGSDGPAARELLVERGLTAQRAAAIAERLGRLAEFVDEVAPEDPQQLRDAEDAMWAWYLEWSAIARQAITNRAVLRKLGFLRRSRAQGEDEEDLAPEELTPLEASLAESSVGEISAPQLPTGEPTANPNPDTSADDSAYAIAIAN